MKIFHIYTQRTSEVECCSTQSTILVVAENLDEALKKYRQKYPLSEISSIESMRSEVIA